MQSMSLYIVYLKWCWNDFNAYLLLHECDLVRNSRREI